MGFDILMFLYHNPDLNTAADITRTRKSTKSHVSTSLQTLEDRRLIKRKVDDNKRKLKYVYCLVLTISLWMVKRLKNNLGMMSWLV